MIKFKDYFDKFYLYFVYLLFYLIFLSKTILFTGLLIYLINWLTN